MSKLVVPLGHVEGKGYVPYVHPAEVERLRAEVEVERASRREWQATAHAVTDPRPDSSVIFELGEAHKKLRAEHATVLAAIEAHKERWTSVNSGDIRTNARPADLELWDALDTLTDVAS